MPIYEYKCARCGEVFEELVSLGGHGPAVRCPNCHSKRARKLVSAFAAKLSAPSRGAACAPSG